MTVEVPIEEEEVTREIDETLKRLRKEVAIPGFRPGKVPIQVIAARIGKAKIRKETLDELVPTKLEEYAEKSDSEIISILNFEIVEGALEGAVKIKAELELYPEVNIPGYDGLKVTIPPVFASEADIDAQIEKLRRTNGELRQIEREVRENDSVTISLQAKDADGKEISALGLSSFAVEIGKDDIIESLSENLKGLKIGEQKTFSTKSPIDSNEIEATVTVEDANELILPELSDEWAQDASEFETLEELRESIKINLDKQFKARANYRFDQEVRVALTELLTVEPPLALVDAEMNSIAHAFGHDLESKNISLSAYLQAYSLTEEDLANRFKIVAYSNVKLSMAVRALVDELNIVISEDELKDQVTKYLEESNQDEDVAVEDFINNPDNAKGLKTVESMIKELKVFDWLEENVEIVDENGLTIENSVLFGDDENDKENGSQVLDEERSGENSDVNSENDANQAAETIEATD